jgi:Flp pilus assembly protein TadG
MTPTPSPAPRKPGLLRRFLSDRTGSTTVEFVIIFPMIFAVLVSTIDAGILMMRQVLLERAVDITVRDLRLGRLPGITHDQLRTRICNNTVLMPNCTGIMLVEMRPVSTETFAGLNAPRVCIDRAEEVQPVTTFTPGQINQLMVVRACARFDPLFPQTPYGLNLPGDGNGGYALTATSIFVNEP